MIKKSVLLLFLIVLLANINCKSQNIYTLNSFRDTLSNLFDQLFSFDGTKYYKSDSDKVKINNKILEIFPEVLNADSVFNYNFNIKHIGSIYSDDKLLRIITWNIKFTDGSFLYYGYILHRKKKKSKVKIFPLIDKSNDILNPTNQILNNLQWYGALYYQIINTKNAGKNYYTLLGWDGNNYITTKKIIDVLTFSHGNPIFGKNIFETNKENKKQKRIIFEYSSKTVMTLRYEPKLKSIIFDHLSPIQQTYKGNYHFYGPDFSYDSYFFDKGIWKLKEDIKINNPKNKK